MGRGLAAADHVVGDRPPDEVIGSSRSPSSAGSDGTEPADGTGAGAAATGGAGKPADGTAAGNADGAAGDPARWMLWRPSRCARIQVSGHRDLWALATILGRKTETEIPQEKVA